MLPEIEGKIKRILISDLGVSPELADCSGSDTPLLGRGIGIDSMETLTLVSGVEREFGIEVEDQDLTTELFQTIGSLAAFIQRQIDSEGPGG